MLLRALAMDTNIVRRTDIALALVDIVISILNHIDYQFLVLQSVPDQNCAVTCSGHSSEYCGQWDGTYMSVYTTEDVFDPIYSDDYCSAIQLSFGLVPYLYGIARPSNTVNSISGNPHVSNYLNTFGCASSSTSFQAS